MKPNYEESLAFLKAFRPTGFWVLTSIYPLREANRKTDTRSFATSEETEVLAWLEEQGKDCNIYFSVNPTRKPMAKKASREDIASMEYLQVDLDPRNGEEFDPERERILSMLTERLPEGVPEPTFVTDSGGGYWGFWRLADPFPIDGDSAKYEEAKRFNVQLEILFDGDNCHNVDRIARLPGTVNFPNERKIAKGRGTYLSSVFKTSGETYPLSKFQPAPLQQSSSLFEGFDDKAAVDIVTDNVERLSHVDDLGPDVKEFCKVVIAMGTDPDDPQRFDSRSEALFYVCCELVRSGIGDQVIYSVITDPQFKIAESVIEQGRRAENYALKQIRTAKEHAINPRLAEMNHKHAVIGDIDGKCRIISEQEDEAMDRTVLTYQTAADFTIRYEHIMVSMGEEEVPLGIWWRKHKQRRQYERIVFSPGHDVAGAYNLWKGFAVEARPGKCEIFLDHILRNICAGDRECYDYLVGWMAQAVQHPDEQGHVAVVMRGPKGAGKGKFATTFGRLFGRHFVPVVNANHLVGNFNAHLRDCSILFADEAFYAGDKKHESVLKSLITEDTLMVEGKGVNALTSRNYLHVIMASNEDWVVPAGGDERRYLVLDVASGNKQDHDFFSKLDEQMDNGGREALLHFLLNYDLSEFNVRAAPKTAALREQKEQSMSIEEDWWFSKLQSGEMFPGDGWGRTAVISHMTYDFIEHTRMFGGQRRSNSTRLGMFLKKAMPKYETKRLSGQHSVITMGGETEQVDRPRVYVVPTLEECRSHFDATFGGPFNWPDDNETITLTPETAKHAF